MLPGTHRTRVFIGGSYVPTHRRMLTVLENAATAANFTPIVADQYALLFPDRDIHDVTLFLLHSCRLAVFEMSTLSGALIEIERCSDYGLHKALLLYQDPFNRRWPGNPAAWTTSAMVKSLAAEHAGRFKVRPYVRPNDAAREVNGFLRAIRRSVYGRVHGI
jgi:hypothetical protein